ncbi:iron-containing alcohol dehydrogenase [Labrys okinawensis]|uniref:iron-containing alcohol dehydrogenase n=1 Tax=Labrys okinawensis TaxID=346911 RepID=UPI0039BC81D6
MSQLLLHRLLEGTLTDSETGERLSVPVRKVTIGTGLGPVAAQLVASLGLGRRLAVVMDPDTRRAMGEAVAGALSAGHLVESIVLDAHPHPDMEVVEEVRAMSREADGLIAVGSGSINDIVKHAAHLSGKPYAVFGTALSMNGYTSSSAAITEKGLKKSLASTAPQGVFLDLDVLAAAPKRLIAAGFGDSICRCTAQTDWLMSHLIRDTRYREIPFALQREEEAALMAHPGRLIAGDREAVALLARMLVLSGFGMTLAGGSYPASQSEHLVAHYIDMRGQNLPRAYHGEHIAVTTVTVARLQERMLGRTSLAIRASADTPALFAREFGAQLGAECWSAFEPKLLDEEGAAALNRRLAADWPDIRRRLLAVSRPSTEVKAALQSVDAPVKPADVGIPDPFYSEALRNARRIRDRFGVLDLAEAAGELDDFVAAEMARPAAHA